MSAETAPRVGVQREHRMLNLGDAVPISIGTFGEKRAPASEGKKHAEIVADHEAWRDGQETTSRCTECPDWSFTGPAVDARAASAAHRVELHPELVGRRTLRRGRAALTRGSKTAGQVADIEASKAARVERDRAELEERLEITAQRLNKTGESSHGDRHTPDQEAPMPGTRPSPTRDAILARLERGEASVPDLIAATGSTRGSIEQTCSKMRKSGHIVRVRAGVFALPGAAHVEPQPSPPSAEPTPELNPERTIEIVLLPAKTAAPEHLSPLVRLLSKLTTEDLEAAAGDLEQLQRRLQAEHALVTEALDTKAA